MAESLDENPTSGLEFEFYVIYRYPPGFPGKYIAIHWTQRRGRLAAVGVAAYGQTVAAVRRELPPWLTCSPRDPLDDPAIVETWL